MKAYYGSRISPNMTETPEGYLVAHNVPVARTGYQEYLGREIGLDTDDRVKVYRDPDEVFSPKTMASFEGKSVTNDHPPVGLDAENTRDYEMGHTTNVRRGTGADSDLLLADLIIKDKRFGTGNEKCRLAMSATMYRMAMGHIRKRTSSVITSRWWIKGGLDIG